MGVFCVEGFICIICDPQSNRLSMILLFLKIRNMKLRGRLNDLIRLTWTDNSRAKVHWTYLASKLMLLWELTRDSQAGSSSGPFKAHGSEGSLESPWTCAPNQLLLCDECRKVWARRKTVIMSSEVESSYREGNKAHYEHSFIQLLLFMRTKLVG